MLSRIGKIIISFLLFSIAITLFIYGVFFHNINISPQQYDGSATLVASVASEPALIKEVSVGGVKRDDSGKIKQTYTGQAPKACPT
jgi:membrane protein involved in colicin uptake